MSELAVSDRTCLVVLTQDVESMTTEGRAYFLTSVLDDMCRCDDQHSGSSMPPSVTASLSPPPLPPLQVAVVERSSSALSAPPPVNVGRRAATSSDSDMRHPVRRTQTISGHAMQPPRQLSPLQRSAELNPTGKNGKFCAYFTWYRIIFMTIYDLFIY